MIDAHVLICERAWYLCPECIVFILIQADDDDDYTSECTKGPYPQADFARSAEEAVVEMADSVVESGDSVIESADSVIESANSVVESGDSVVESVNSVVESGDSCDSRPTAPVSIV